MAPVCIITDSSAYYPNPDLSSTAWITTIPLQVQVGNRLVPDSKDPLKYKSYIKEHKPRRTKLIPPSVEDLCKLFHVSYHSLREKLPKS